MIDYSDYFKIKPYSADREEKQRMLTSVLKGLTCFHMQNCREYWDFLGAYGIRDEDVSESLKDIDSYEELPFMPVRAFKELSLCSVPKENVVKTMTSSGTTGQQVSKIYLDKETSANQTKVMTGIVSDFIGTKRLPMIILDTPRVIRDRNMFSARGAGILGFSIFGRDKIYAFDDNMELDIDRLKEFLEKHEGEDIFLFGFTFMIWEYFYKKLKDLQGINKSADTNEENDSDYDAQYLLNLSRGIMIHGGGWKKLQSEAVSPEMFKASLKNVCGIDRVYNYYGMVEQTGTIYMECECGHLHTSVFSDVIIRNHEDWSIQPNGKKGLIEVVSCLPKSYPGHILLTEDEGIVDGEDDCPCGRKGKYFRVLGRIKEAELRGCSDTYAVSAPDIKEEIIELCGKYNNCEVEIKPLMPFDDNIINYLAHVSDILLKSKEAKAYPDIITFGFFCRRANLLRMKKQYTGYDRDNICDGNVSFGRQNEPDKRIGRGLVFHVAPSNVPVNFAYSLVSALLAGNVSIIKASSKDFPQTRIICNALNRALDETQGSVSEDTGNADKEKNSNIRNFVNVIMYDRNNQSITEKLSSRCNMRIIWGGDNTVAKVREAKLPPRSFDIAFADRYSMAVINAYAILDAAHENNMSRIASDFYNDTYLTDQNACSSPRMIYWIGDSDAVTKAKDLFWNAIYGKIKDIYETAPVIAVNKHMAAVRTSILIPGSIVEDMPDNRIVRISIPRLSDAVLAEGEAGGFFLEYSSETLHELQKIVNEKFQTLTYYGMEREDLVKLIIDNRLTGIDRVVPMGHSMDFDLIWDGYDLIGMMSRVIQIKL